MKKFNLIKKLLMFGGSVIPLSIIPLSVVACNNPDAKPDIKPSFDKESIDKDETRLVYKLQDYALPVLQEIKTQYQMDQNIPVEKMQNFLTVVKEVYNDLLKYKSNFLQWFNNNNQVFEYKEDWMYDLNILTTEEYQKVVDDYGWAIPINYQDTFVKLLNSKQITRKDYINMYLYTNSILWNMTRWVEKH
ncbi:hypothetical protein [Mycoplasma seminis]|uniref:Lipoprotein n=1 Tax=Mycoplasma seminis TaxID=512749 RepID=A0ABY9HAK2_9MOLU|nr:hypothetical protein [Mycoplasma seminis]WLP85637.1 hypothetical protein Q8852_00545 [Mycoplasma seminis]